jgi:hypothetical protein
MTDENPSHLSRRKMIAFAAAGTVAAGARAAPLRSVLSNPLLTSPLFRPLAVLAYGDWATMVGNGFTLTTESGRGLSLKLSKVTALPVSVPRPPSLRAQPFMISLTGAVLPFGNRVYTIIHPTHGALNVFFDAATKAGLTAQFN